MALDEAQRGKLYATIAKQLGVPVEDVAPEKKLIDDLHADSLDQVELIMAVEDAFEIEISDKTAEDVVTVQDIDNLVEKVLAAKSAT